MPHELALECDPDCDSGRLHTIGHSHSLNSALGASECNWSGVVATATVDTKTCPWTWFETCSETW